MKKLLLIFVAIISLSVSAGLYDNNIRGYHENSDESEDTTCSILPDHLIGLVRKGPSILYAYGHHGYSWSIITKKNKEFRAYSGRESYVKQSSLTDNPAKSNFDSSLFFSKNKDILLWALDTLPRESLKMKPIDRQQYVTFYTDLSIFNNQGLRLFNSKDAVGFSGQDSLEFNKKYHRLCLIMYWLSNYEIRQYIPDSLIWNN